MACCCEGHRKQTQEVCYDDEHEQCHYIREEDHTVFASYIFNHFVDEAVGQFSNGLAARWDQSPSPCAKNQQCHNRQNRQAHPKRDIGDCKPFNLISAKQWRDLKLIHWVKYEARFCFAVCFCCQGLNPLYLLQLAPCAFSELLPRCASLCEYRQPSPNL